MMGFRVAASACVAVLATVLVVTESVAEPPSPDAVAVGRPVPDFALPSVDGEEVRLSAFRGKVVVLEWFNPDCPFARYAHTKGPLTDLGNRHTDSGHVWLAINSSAPGRQGHGTDLNRRKKAEFGMRYPVLLDESGRVGGLYTARTTPQVFVIDTNGILMYRGAVDNAPLGDAGGATVVHYLGTALDSISRGQPIRAATTRPYGCSIKYRKKDREQWKK